MIEYINVANALYNQISALLDLMIMSEDSVDHKSIRTAAEMCETMVDDYHSATEDLYDDWKSGLLKEPEANN